jgi:PDZ domain
VKGRAILFLIVTGSSVLAGLWLRTKLRPTPSADISIPKAGAVVPFELYGGHLFVKATLSGTAAQPSKVRTSGVFLLDSGAADMFISASKAQALGLSAQPQSDKSQSDKSQSALQKNNDRKNASERGPTVYVPNVAYQVGALAVKDHQSAILPKTDLEELSQYFGRPIDGIIGYELFQQLVVEMDYAKHQLHLYSPKTYQYRSKGARLPMQIEDRRPYVEAVVSPYGLKPLQSRLLVDSGSNGALSVATGCGLDQMLIAKAPKILRRQLATINGVQQISVGRVQALDLAQWSLKTPITVFETNPRACDLVTGKIGTQILQQFRVTFDYPQQQLILEPQTDLNRTNANEYDLSGLRLQANGNQLKTYRVTAVFPGTPAAAAGLQQGDILSQLNRQPTAQMSLGQIRQRLSQPGQTVDLQVQRRSQRIQSRLKLKPLL